MRVKTALDSHGSLTITVDDYDILPHFVRHAVGRDGTGPIVIAGDPRLAPVHPVTLLDLMMRGGVGRDRFPEHTYTVVPYIFNRGTPRWPEPEDYSQVTPETWYGSPDMYVRRDVLRMKASSEIARTGHKPVPKSVVLTIRRDYWSGKMSQRELATQFGIHANTVYRICNGLLYWFDTPEGEDS